MVFFYISKYVTKWIGTPLFRNGLRLRNRLATTRPTPGAGVVSPTNNNYWMDMACMIPYSQKIISLAVYDESKRLALEFRKQYEKEQQERSKGSADAAMATIAMLTDPSATSRLSKRRLNVLDDYLRPSLIPNNRWSDIEENWRYHLRIVAWARKEFLISKHGPHIQEALVAYPQLRNSPQLSSVSSSKRQLLLDLVHRGVINTDNIGGGETAVSNHKNEASPFLRLPPSEIILDAFRMKGWSNDKSTERIGQSLVPIAKNLGGSIIRHQQQPPSSKGGSGMTKHVDIPVETDVKSTTLEDILEVVTKGYVKNCGPLNALCLEANFYQFYSREYVQQLGDYLLKRTAAGRLAEQQHGPRLQNNETNDFLKETPLASTETIVLDIGAGDGVLMNCLRDYMERKVMGLSLTDGRQGNKRRKNDHTHKTKSINRHWQPVVPTMIATDDMSWKIFTKAEVEKLTVEQALEKYTTKLLSNTAAAATKTNDTDNNLQSSDSSIPSDTKETKQRPQVIVMCSWMPMGQDWTHHFRNAKVDEYILIGEADDGSCGDNWLTWGNPAFYNNDATAETNNDEAERKSKECRASSPTPPYVEEGYQRLDMDPLTKYQYSSFDLANSKSSKTVSFRRRKMANDKTHNTAKLSR